MRTLVFLSVFSLRLLAQESDSLLVRLLSIKNDTERVNQLYKRGYALRNNNPGLSFQYAKRCEKEALNTESKRHVAKSYNLLGILYYKKGDYKTALSYHQQAMQLRVECNDVLGLAHSKTNLGNIYSDLRLYQKAEEAYLAALQAYQELDNKSMKANCLVNLGVLKQENGQTDLAFEYYKSAIKIADEIHDYEIKSLCLNNIAAVYYDTGDFERSIGYNLDALKLRELMDNHTETADSYINLGNNYIKLKLYEKARYYLDTAYLISVKNDYFEARYEASKSYAAYFSAIKNFEAAFEWLNKYNGLKDSLILQQDAERRNYGFEEKDFESKETSQHLSNSWLLFAIVILLIFIPLYLIRFKR